MKVRITEGHGWYKDLVGKVFEVIKDDGYPGGYVYLLMEDAKDMSPSSVRYVAREDCEVLPDELEALRAELERTRAALAAAGKYIDSLTDMKIVSLSPSKIKKAEELEKEFVAALSLLTVKP